MLTRFYDEEKYCYGFKDEDGSIVIPAAYDNVEEFENGFAVVQPDGSMEWGLIDETGKVIIPFEYDYVFVYKTWVHTAKEKAHFLFNTNGELLLQLNDIVYWQFPREDVIQVKKKTGWGAINLTGETIIDFIYKSIGPCINGWLSYYADGKWGWLTNKGEIAIAASFDEVGVLDKERWWGKKGKLCYVYDYEMNEVGIETWENIKKKM